jgi:transaldolase
VNAPQQLHEAGQSLWLDAISRRLLTSGRIAHYIDALALTGLTSNPTILGHAMSSSGDYDNSIRHYLDEGVGDPQELVFACALADLRAAADLFMPVWETTGTVDGWVSLEVPPELAYKSVPTIEAAQRLHARAERPNLFIKVPGTPSGLAAFEELIVAGIPVNVTLLFSDAQYVATANAYLRALEQRNADSKPLNVVSVASVFVSRWDSAADPLLPRQLHGKLGVAIMQQIYASHRNLLASDRWKTLQRAGAIPQRLLWASTSTKDPTFPDTYYVGKLAAPGTINTMPEKTLLAFADHGEVGELLEPDYAAAEKVIAAAAAEGLDINALAESLQTHGAETFGADWRTLLTAIAGKAARLRGVDTRT